MWGKNMDQSEKGEWFLKHPIIVHESIYRMGWETAEDKRRLGYTNTLTIVETLP
jgi:hypothetical protein